MRRAALLLILTSLLAACGDDDAATTAATTAAPTSTTVPTTTTSTTTTIPADIHPAWGVSWQDAWPEADAGATYLVQIAGDDPVELPARVEYGVEWRDGTWDRIVLGSTEPGETGAVLYLERPEPWVLRLWGMQSTTATFGVYEYFHQPPILDLRGLPDAPSTVEGGLVIEVLGGQASEPLPVSYRLEWVGFETIVVEAGTIADALHCRIVMTGEFFEGTFPDEVPYVSDMWLHPEQLLVKWDLGPGFGALELVSPWE